MSVDTAACSHENMKIDLSVKARVRIAIPLGTYLFLIMHFCIFAHQQSEVVRHV